MFVGSAEVRLSHTVEEGIRRSMKEEKNPLQCKIMHM